MKCRRLRSSTTSTSRAASKSTPSDRPRSACGCWLLVAGCCPWFGDCELIAVAVVVLLVLVSFPVRAANRVLHTRACCDPVQWFKRNSASNFEDVATGSGTDGTGGSEAGGGSGSGSSSTLMARMRSFQAGPPQRNRPATAVFGVRYHMVV